MKNVRKYGRAPYGVAVIHGGPGSNGEVAPVCKKLSAKFGVLEPLQTATTLVGQVKELRKTIQDNGKIPIILIGHSWGAWLVFIVAARYPSLVKKVILISSGPFKSGYSDIDETRLSRLNKDERLEMQNLWASLSQPTKAEHRIFVKFFQLLTKADSFDPLPNKTEKIDFCYDIYKKVWPGGAKLRREGKLLQYGPRIKCPVVAIHGDYDPHPAKGVKEPLSRKVKNFKFILLKKCGHKPWIERYAKARFYEILKKELR